MANVIITNDSNDNIVTGATQEVVFSLGGDDTIDTGMGNDIVFAGNDQDIILGGNDNDLLFGGRGDDEIYGQEGNDLIIGGAGNDFIEGGLGSDYMFGGAGADEFNYVSTSESSGRFFDRIFGFEQGNDVINLSALDFDGISSFADITIDNQGSATTISGNSTDFFVQLQGGYDLTSADFIF